MKRGSSDKDIETKKQRLTVTNNSVRLLIPSHIAGAVIGKKGVHIQKIRSEYNAQISVDDCSGPERIIYISAQLDSVINVIRELLQYFEEKNNEIDLRLLIHQSLAGCVIGRNGDRIKIVRNKIGCRIYKVFPDIAPLSTDRVIQVIGTLDQCTGTVQEIMNLIKTTPIRGSIRNYDAANFSEVNANKYGGYCHGSNEKFFNRENVNQNYQERNVKNQNFNGINQKNINLWNNQGNSNRKLEANCNLANQNLILNSINSVGENLNTFERDLNEFDFNKIINKNVKNYDYKIRQVSIPNGLINVVIASIHHVRDKCGAVIEIEQSKPNVSDGIISIGGNTKQIELAQFLLQQSVFNFIQQ